MNNTDKEDLILREQFQKSYQSIKLPDDFKVAVLSEMKKEVSKTGEEENISQTEKNRIEQEALPMKKQAIQTTFSGKKKQVKKRQIGMAALALCAASLVLFMVRPVGVSYVTPMEDGVYYDTVELKNGEIHFVKNRVAISITPNAGQVVIGGASSGEANAEKKIEVLEEMISESGGDLLFQKTEQTAVPEIAEDNWSNIGKQRIYVTVLKTEKVRYQAVFEKEDNAYQVVGTDVTQKEFIDYLYEKVKKH